MEERSGPLQPYRAEIFAIGDELLFGRIYDTNSFWLAERLSGLGASVRRITCLPDDDETLVAEFAASLARGADLVLTTGGLGPTVDDRTLEAVAEVTGGRVVVDQSTLASFAERRKVPIAELPQSLHKMATVVEGATVWPNPVGWAPAVEVQADRQRIICLPGPPREVQGVFDTHLAPRLADLFGRRTRAVRVRSTLHESGVAPLLQEVMREHPGTYLKALVSLSDANGLPIDVVAHGVTLDAATSLLLQAIEALRLRIVAQGRALEELEEQIRAG